MLVLQSKDTYLELLQWARQNGCPWYQSTPSGVALNGHLRVVQWARRNGCPWDEDTCLQRPSCRSCVGL